MKWTENGTVGKGYNYRLSVFSEYRTSRKERIEIYSHSGVGNVRRLHVFYLYTSIYLVSILQTPDSIYNCIGYKGYLYHDMNDTKLV